MRASRALSWLVPGVLSACIATLWCTVLSPSPTLAYFFEVELKTPAQASVQIYFNRGAGLRESESSSQVVNSPDAFVHVRLPLPSGKYRQLRFDPIDHNGSVTFRDARIVAFNGRVIRRFVARDFSPNDQVARYAQRDGAAYLETTATANDPMLSVDFNPVLRLGMSPWSSLALAAPAWLGVFGATFLVLALFVVVIRRRKSLPGAALHFCRTRPCTSLAICAAFAAIASSYPVVFFGKSFVSPANGALMLYDHSPTVPGDYDSRPEDPRGSDVGAMHWAHLPYTVIASHALFNEGTLPLWNRYNSCGVTLLGQGQSMLGDPLHFLVILAGGKTWAFDIKFVLCKALFAFAVGLCVWLLTRDTVASLIITFASAFVAFYNYRVNHPAIFSFSYSPWILVGWLQMLQARDGRTLRRSLLLWFAANWFVITSGTAKEAYLLCAMLNATGGLAFLLSPEALRFKLRRAVPIALVGFAFLLTSSLAWLNFLDALGTAKTMYDTPIAFQIPPAWLAGFFDSIFFVEQIPGHLVYTPAANFLILLGCLWAVTQPRLLWTNRSALAVLLGLLLALSIAFGWMPAAWIVQVPFLRNVEQVNNHFSCIGVVLACVLAGAGFSYARPALANRNARWYSISILVLITLLFSSYFRQNPLPWTGGRGLSGWIDLLPTHAFFYLYVFLLVVALGTLTFLAARHVRGRPLTSTVLLAGGCAMLIVLARHGQHLPFGIATRYFRFPGARADLLVPSPATEFLQREIRDEPGRIIGTGNTLFTGFIAVYGFESPNGPDAIYNRQYRELLDAAQWPAPYDWHFALLPHQLPAWRPMLDFLNVRYIGAAPGLTLDTTYHERVAALDLDIYRGKTTWPRAFFTDRLEQYRDAADFLALLGRHPPGQPFAAVQAGDSSAPPSTSAAGPGSASTPAADYHLTSNTTAFTVNSTGPGYAVLGEAWLPEDFRVTLDGRPVPYFRINHAFKGVVVPDAGTHRIVFTYWPRHLTLTLILAAAGLVLWIGTCTCARRLSGPPAASSPSEF